MRNIERRERRSILSSRGVQLSHAEIEKILERKRPPLHFPDCSNFPLSTAPRIVGLLAAPDAVLNPITINTRTKESLSEIAYSRLATAEDEAFLFRLFAESRMAELAGCGIPQSQTEMLVQLQRRGQQMTYLRQYPQAENLILLSQSGIPAGRLLLDRQPEHWRIVDVAVLEEFQRRGITTRAIRDCQSRTPPARLELQVNPANPARTLYQRLGFRVVTRTAASLEMVWTDPSASE